MATESTNQPPLCHPNGKWVVASNGSAFCSVCGRGLNAALKIDTPMPEVSPVKEEPKAIAEVFQGTTEAGTEFINKNANFRETAVIWEALQKSVKGYGNWNTTQNFAVHMLFVSLARACRQPDVREHWDDIIDYARLAGDVCSE